MCEALCVCVGRVHVSVGILEAGSDMHGVLVPDPEILVHGCEG